MCYGCFNDFPKTFGNFFKDPGDKYEVLSTN